MLLKYNIVLMKRERRGRERGGRVLVASLSYLYMPDRTAYTGPSAEGVVEMCIQGDKTLGSDSDHKWCA